MGMIVLFSREIRGSVGENLIMNDGPSQIEGTDAYRRPPEKALNVFPGRQNRNTAFWKTLNPKLRPMPYSFPPRSTSIPFELAVTFVNL